MRALFMLHCVRKEFVTVVGLYFYKATCYPRPLHLTHMPAQ
jgi:hypothetical protein